MVKIEISSSVFIVVENTSDTLWSILGNLVSFTDINGKCKKTNVIIGEKIKENSFDKFVDACLEEFGHSFRGSVLIIEDVETDKSSLSKAAKKNNLILDAANNIFRKVNENYEDNYCLSVSYLEICYEYILDLLDDNKRIQHSEQDDFQKAVQNVKKQEIYSPDAALDIITKGTNRRSYEDNSHTIFNISLTQKRKTNEQGAILESHLNFLFLSGCVDKTGAFGDQIRKGCAHFTINQVVDHLDVKDWNNVNAQDSILQLVLKQFLGGIRIICTISSDSFEDPLDFLRFTGASTDSENELVTLSADGFPLHGEVNSQDEPDYITKKEKATRMYQQSTSHYAVHAHNTQLETIEEEEEEEMEETRFPFDGNRNILCFKE
ncbi:hypothetical protein C0J52_12500 [Blattella germanica]|nr:hypothetical protein C0J52_12500 [Blattella germanica]